jgi:hypothetical protein
MKLILCYTDGIDLNSVCCEQIIKDYYVSGNDWFYQYDDNNNYKFSYYYHFFIWFLALFIDVIVIKINTKIQNVSSNVSIKYYHDNTMQMACEQALSEFGTQMNLTEIKKYTLINDILQLSRLEDYLILGGLYEIFNLNNAKLCKAIKQFYELVDEYKTYGVTLTNHRKYNIINYDASYFHVVKNDYIAMYNIIKMAKWNDGKICYDSQNILSIKELRNIIK